MYVQIGKSGFYQYLYVQIEKGGFYQYLYVQIEFGLQLLTANQTHVLQLPYFPTIYIANKARML